jgi:hypothetical protein
VSLPMGSWSAIAPANAPDETPAPPVAERVH